MKSKNYASAKSAEELGTLLGLSKSDTALMKSKAQLDSLMAEARKAVKKAKGNRTDVKRAIKRTRQS